MKRRKLIKSSASGAKA